MKNSSAQLDSIMSKCGMGIMRVIGVMGVMGDMGQERIVKKHYAQWDSKFSKLGNRTLSPSCLFSPSVSQKPPVEPHSKNSKCGVGGLGVLGSLGILGWKTKTENDPAQPHSNISKLEIIAENTPAQLDSKFSKCGVCPIGPMRPIGPIRPIRPIRQELPPVEPYSKNSKCGVGGWEFWEAWEYWDGKLKQKTILLNHTLNSPICGLGTLNAVFMGNRLFV